MNGSSPRSVQCRSAWEDPCPLIVYDPAKKEPLAQTRGVIGSSPLAGEGGEDVYGGLHETEGDLVLTGPLALAYYTTLIVRGDLDAGGFDLHVGSFGTLEVTGRLFNVRNLTHDAFTNISVGEVLQVDALNSGHVPESGAASGPSLAWRRDGNGGICDATLHCDKAWFAGQREWPWNAVVNESEYGSYLSATAIHASGALIKAFTQVNVTCGDVEVANLFMMPGPMGELTITSGSLTADIIQTSLSARIDAGWDVIARSLYVRSASHYMMDHEQAIPILRTHHNVWLHDGIFDGSFDIGGSLRLTGRWSMEGYNYGRSRAASFVGGDVSQTNSTEDVIIGSQDNLTVGGSMSVAGHVKLGGNQWGGMINVSGDYTAGNFTQLSFGSTFRVGGKLNASALVGYANTSVSVGGEALIRHYGYDPDDMRYYCPLNTTKWPELAVCANTSLFSGSWSHWQFNGSLNCTGNVLVGKAATLRIENNITVGGKLSVLSGGFLQMDKVGPLKHHRVQNLFVDSHGRIEAARRESS